MVHYTSSVVAYYEAHNDTEEVGMKAASSRYFQHMRSLSCPLRH